MGSTQTGSWVQGVRALGFWALAFEFRVRGSKGFDARVVRFRFWAAGLRVSGFRV